MTTPDTETRPLRMTAPRTALDVLEVLRKVSLSEATLFKAEYRTALLAAADTFDLAPAEHVLLRWRGVAHHRKFPPTEEEREIHRRLRAGDPLDELPTEPRRRTTTHV